MSFTALYFFKILNRPYACFRQPRFSDIIFQRVRTLTCFTWEFFWFALLWEFTAPNLHEIAWDGGLGGLEVICVQKYLHINLNLFFFYFFYHWQRSFPYWAVSNMADICSFVTKVGLLLWFSKRGKFVGALVALSAMLPNISHEAIRK